MQKLKKVFSPGNDKDDEMMYGTPRKSADTGNSHSSATGHSDTASPTTQSQTSPSQEKYQGSSSQVRNTDSDKYDGQQYDKPMTISEPPTVKPSEKQEDVLASRMGTSKDDNSVKRQVLDPSDSKRDETGYAATGFTNKHAEDTKTTPRQPNELGNVPPSNDSYTSTTTAATAAPGSAFTTNTRTMPPETDSRMSMKSGVVGSSDQRTTDRALGSDGITGERTPGSQADSSSNFSRNAALAGAGAAAGAGGAYAATRQRRQSRTSGDQDVEDATYTDRSFPLRGGTTSHLQENRQASSVYSNDAAGPSSTSAYIDPSTSGSQQTDAGGLGYGSGSAAVAGAGAGAVGAAATKEKLADHTKHSHEYHGDPCLEGGHSPADKTLPHVPGPHQTVAANLEDPHVPGEFPKEDGTDPHGRRGLGGFGGTSSQQQPTLLSNKQPDVKATSSYPMQSSPSEAQSSDHHHGTLAAGAGAAGLGTYAATRDRGTTSGDALSRDVGSPQTSSAVPTQTPKQALDDSATAASEPKKEHHYGRNAAVAGGTGVAGAAAYTAYQRSKDRDDAVPSSQATAPRESNVAGPITSSKDTAPRESTVGAPSATQTHDVTKSTAPKDEKEHHYGRDAALAGGAGAAGYGAYQYSKDRGNDDLGSKTTDPDDTYRDDADPSTRPETSSRGAMTGPHTSTTSKADPYTAPQQQQQQQQQYQQTSPPQEEHHYGRNAALAGGAGAAGAAGYSALQSERGDTGPASKTIGPHESNVANILDPRVRPEPEKMKDHTTAGPWQSDTLNKLDPKVESNPDKADIKAHGYASGVAPQQMQQRATAGEQDPEHRNRNAGLAAAGGAAGAGAAAYGAKEAYDGREQGQEMSAKEQEKLAKEHEKEAAKQAKQEQKEAEKQAKHDQKEAEKQQKHDQKEAEQQAKHDAKEREKAQKHADADAEKARKKEEEKALAEQQKAEKKHAHELEKEEKQRSKDAEKAEKERLHEQEKLDRQREKEDAQLAEARDEEAERKHHEHNKLHKTPPEEREKKGGILHRIFHHKAHEREGVEPGERQSGSFEGERERGLVGEGGDGVGQLREGQGEGYSQNLGDRDSGVVTEKSTGLPMNVGKYGSGAGGTDGGEHIHGYQGEAR